MDTIPNGHNPEWTQSRMDTIPKGQHPEWTQSRMGTIPKGHNPEWTQSRMDTITNLEISSEIEPQSSLNLANSPR